MSSDPLPAGACRPDSSTWRSTPTDSRPAAIFLAAILPRLDRVLFQLTRRRRTLTETLTGLPVIWLTTTGAKSGRSRTVPLLALRDRDIIILAATNWGRRQNPGWYLNLKRNPEARVVAAGDVVLVRAREAHEAEIARDWPAFLQMYPGYAAYRQNAADRLIPVIVLSPVEKGTGATS